MLVKEGLSYYMEGGSSRLEAGVGGWSDRQSPSGSDVKDDQHGRTGRW